MPRFFFHTHVGDDIITDVDGVELRDPDHAWEVAKTTIQASLRDPKNQARLMAASLAVVNEAGDVVFEFPFAEAVVLPPRRDGTVH